MQTDHVVDHFPSLFAAGARDGSGSWRESSFSITFFKKSFSIVRRPTIRSSSSTRFSKRSGVLLLCTDSRRNACSGSASYSLSQLTTKVGEREYLRAIDRMD